MGSGTPGFGKCSFRTSLLSYGFIYCWILLYCYDARLSVVDGLPPQLSFLVFSFFQMAAFALLYVFSRELISFVEKRSVVMCFALLSACATLALFPLRTSLLSSAFFSSVFSAIAGIGCAVLSVNWGKEISSYSAYTACIWIALAVALCFVLYLLIGVLPGGLGIVAAASLPLVGAAFLVFGDSSRKSEDSSRQSASPQTAIAQNQSGRLFSGKLALLLLVFGALSSTVINSTNVLAGSRYGSSFEWLIGVANLVVALLFLAGVILFHKRGDVHFTLKPTVLIMGVGIILLLASTSNSLIAGVLFISARSYFFILSSIILADIGHRSSAAVSVFSLGRGADLFGYIIGFGLSLVLRFIFGEGDEFIRVLSIVLTGLLLAMPLFLFNESDMRTGWGMLPEKNESEEKFSRVVESHGITARETEILQLLVQGRSLPFIAKSLYISTSTVKTHVRSIYSKLDVHNRQDLLSIFNASSGQGS